MGAGLFYEVFELRCLTLGQFLFKSLSQLVWAGGFLEAAFHATQTLDDFLGLQTLYHPRHTDGIAWTAAYELHVVDAQLVVQLEVDKLCTCSPSLKCYLFHIVPFFVDYYSAMILSVIFVSS